MCVGLGTGRIGVLRLLQLLIMSASLAMRQGTQTRAGTCGPLSLAWRRGPTPTDIIWEHTPGGFGRASARRLASLALAFAISMGLGMGIQCGLSGRAAWRRADITSQPFLGSRGVGGGEGDAELTWIAVLGGLTAVAANWAVAVAARAVSRARAPAACDVQGVRRGDRRWGGVGRVGGLAGLILSLTTPSSHIHTHACTPMRRYPPADVEL
jgi:hypothetical protein